MDILFINPRTELEISTKIFHREPPNGLLILCAILESAGFDVDFLDLSVKNPKDLEEYLSEEPKVVGITSLTNTRGFSVDFGAATTVLVASKMGMPISTSHTVVGAVIGVGLARGLEAIDLSVIKKIIVSWLLTLPVAAGTSIVIFLMLRTIIG